MLKRTLSATALTAVYNGAHGNASRTTLFHEFAATPADTQVVLGRFPAGTTIDSLTVFNDALAAGSSVELGVSYTSGDEADDLTKFGTAATENEGTAKIEKRPVNFQEDFELVATLKGGVATGNFTVRVDYRFEGQSHADY